MEGFFEFEFILDFSIMFHHYSDVDVMMCGEVFYAPVMTYFCYRSLAAVFFTCPIFCIHRHLTFVNTPAAHLSSYPQPFLPCGLQSAK